MSVLHIQAPGPFPAQVSSVQIMGCTSGSKQRALTAFNNKEITSVAGGSFWDQAFYYFLIRRGYTYKGSTKGEE